MRRTVTLLLMLILSLPLFCGVVNIVDEAYHFNKTMIFEEPCTGMFVANGSGKNKVYMFVFLPYDEEFQESASEAKVIKAINNASNSYNIYLHKYALFSSNINVGLIEVNRRGDVFTVTDIDDERFYNLLKQHVAIKQDAVFTIASFSNITGQLIDDAFMIKITYEDMKLLLKQIDAM